MADQMPHHDLAGYVLGTLTPAETSAFETHLASCPECRAEIAELESLPSLLANAAPAPPATLRNRTLAAIRAAAGADPAIGLQDSVPTSPPPLPPISRVAPPEAPPAITPPATGRPPTAAPQVVTPMRPRRSRAVRWMTAVAAALLVAAAVGVGAILLGRDVGGTPTTTIALNAVEGGSGQGEAVIRQVTSGSEVRLEASGLPANPPGTFYECWLVGPDDTPQAPNRVAVGTFSVGNDGKAAVVWVTAADMQRFPKLGVTLEPDNGDPGTNGPKVLAG